jgi:hypothetical protein
VLGAKVSSTALHLATGGIIKIEPDNFFPNGKWYYYQLLNGKIVKGIPVDVERT